MGLELDIGADISASLGELSSSVSALSRQSRSKVVPIVGSIVGISGQVAATTLPGPDGGFEWDIRRISFAPPLLAGALVSVGTPGTLLIGKSSGLRTSSQGSGQLIVGGTDWIEVARTTTVPNAILFSRGQFILHYPLNLAVLWASGTAGVTLSIDGNAIEVNIAPQREL